MDIIQKIIAEKDEDLSKTLIDRIKNVDYSNLTDEKLDELISHVNKFIN